MATLGAVSSTTAPGADPAEAERQKQKALQFLHDHPLQSNTGVGLALDTSNADEARHDAGSFGGQTWNQNVADYRNEGAAGIGRSPVAIDQTYANKSRGAQLSALGLLRAQGAGTAPSSADILSQRANQDAVMAAGSRVTGAKTAGGGIVAARDAGNAAGSAMLAGNAANAQARAAEISRGQGAYAGGANTAQGQDVGAATTNANLSAEQQALNERRQQEFERRAYDTRKAQIDTGLQKEGNYQGTLQNIRDYNKETAADTANLVGTTAAVGGAVFTGGASAAALAGKAGASKLAQEAARKSLGRTRDTDTSDERAKMHIGSLSALMRGRP